MDRDFLLVEEDLRVHVCAWMQRKGLLCLGRLREGRCSRVRRGRVGAWTQRIGPLCLGRRKEQVRKQEFGARRYHTCGGGEGGGVTMQSGP